MLPLFESQPGFRAYSIAVSGNEIFSFSVWGLDRGRRGRERGGGDRREHLGDHTRRDGLVRPRGVHARSTPTKRTPGSLWRGEVMRTLCGRTEHHGRVNPYDDHGHGHNDDAADDDAAHLPQPLTGYRAPCAVRRRSNNDSDGRSRGSQGWATRREALQSSRPWEDNRAR